MNRPILTLFLAVSATALLPSGALAWGACHSGSTSWGGGSYRHSGSTTWTGDHGNSYTTSHSGSGSYYGGYHSGSAYHYGGVGYGGCYGAGFHAGYVTGPYGNTAFHAGVYRRW